MYSAPSNRNKQKSLKEWKIQQRFHILFSKIWPCSASEHRSRSGSIFWEMLDLDMTKGNISATLVSPLKEYMGLAKLFV
jgi:hypothetical protein